MMQKKLKNVLLASLGDHRVNPRREFLRISPERVKMLLELVAVADATPTTDLLDKEEQETLNRERSRAPVFTFSMVDIEIGSKIEFFRDQTIIAEVASDRTIIFNDEETSLNQATLEIFNTRYQKNWSSCRGPDHWVYGNETLSERRQRMEL